MYVKLVNMPWASIQFPSLGLGILRRRVINEFPDSRIEIVYANLDFLDWITERVHITPDQHNFCWTSYFTGFSEWVFSSALYGDRHWRNEEFAKLVAGSVSEEMLTLGRQLHALAPEYVAELVGRILQDRPDVVGFSTTFAQNSAALAAAKLVKQMAAEVVTVLGGGNCDGPQGAALHRCFPFVDYVNRGEGEVSFTRLLTSLIDKSEPADIPGICWRDAQGSSHANAISAAPLPASALVMPDYANYFQQHAESRSGSWAEPHFVVESSRGCWWGQKHHCTFCGLNGSFMEFRSKGPDEFVAEVCEMAKRHEILNVAVADNIMDMTYLQSAVPKLAATGYDFRISYEIKSNMRREQLASLVDAGIYYVQPGIENLSSHVLRLMDKGVSGCHNVRMLRDAESVGLSVSWNYLFGFPGEAEQDYDEAISQFPAIHHLQPPEAATRIAIERFSPYFNRPDLGFDDLRPAAHYAVIYDLPETDLLDMAYVFDTAHRGIDSEHGKRLEKAVDTWKHQFAKGRLTQCDLGSSLVLSNTRPGFSWRTLRIEEPWQVAAFRLLDQPHTRKALTSKLVDGGHIMASDDVSTLLRDWRMLGLLFEDADQAVHVVPHSANQDLMRCVASEGAPALVPALLHRTGRAPKTDVRSMLRCWRGRDEEALAEADMYVGEVRCGDDPAQTASSVVALGALHVVLPGPVIIGHDGQTCERDNVRMLTLVRELTGRGISVDWELDLGSEVGQWELFNHLYPPHSVAGADGEGILDRWRRSWHMNKCGYRRGEGFIEIIDLRHGSQRRIVMRKVHDGKLKSLLKGASVENFQEAEVEAFITSGLVHRIGDLLWWTPAHITRWPVVR